MKLNESVLRVVRGVGGAAVIAAMSAGCASGPAAQPRNATTVAAKEAPPQSRQNAQSRQTTQSEPTWTDEDMMAACGRG